MITWQEYKAALGEFANTLTDEEIQRANEISGQLAIILFDMWRKTLKQPLSDPEKDICNITKTQS